MMLDETEIADLPARLFALAGRRIEQAQRAAERGEARGLPDEEHRSLAGALHDCAQDLAVIADAIAAMTAAHMAGEGAVR